MSEDKGYTYEFINAFVKRTGCAIARKTVRKLAIEVGLPKLKRGNVTRNANLDTLNLKYNFHALKAKVYLLTVLKPDESNSGLCKIGIAYDPDARIAVLNKAWKGICIFKLTKTSNFFSREKALKLESSIHTVLEANNLKYQAKHNLDGYSELFRYVDYITELIPNPV